MIERRQALGLLAGGVAACAVNDGAAAAPPSDRLTTYMKMRGALDGRLVIGCVTGRYFGVVDAVMTPLYGLTAATFSRYKARADGGYDAVTFEQAYFTDLASGAVIDRWRNPYTGEEVDVPVTSMPPSRLVVTPELEIKLAKPMPGGSFSHSVSSVETRGDDVWLTETTQANAAFPGAKPFRYGEIVSLHARRADLAKPGQMRVRCDTNFTAVVSWRPWLKMGDRPGHLLGSGSGVYGATLATMPPNWIAATKARRPELLTEPGKPLDALWATL